MKIPNHIIHALVTLNQYHAGIVRADLLTMRQFRASQSEKRCKGWSSNTVFIKAEPLKAWLHSMPIEKADEMLASEMLMGWWQEDNGEPNPHDEAGEYITNHGGLATFTDDAFEPCMIDDAVDSRLGGGCMFLDLSTFNMPVYREPVKEKMTMPTAVGYLSDLLAKECLLQGDQQALRTVLDLLDSIEVVTDDETETK